MNISLAPRRLLEVALCAFLMFSILWKGGKALDATWLLTFVACGFILVSAYVSAKTTEKSEAVPIIVLLPAVAFLGWTFLSFVFSTTRNYGFDEVLQTSSLVLLFLWVIAEGRHLPMLRSHVARTIATALLIACGIGIAVYVYQPVNRFVGTFFDYRFHTDYWPNAWGEFVLLAWPMLLWSLFRDGRASLKSDGLKALVLGLVFGCLLLSFSRGSILAFGGQLGLLAVLSWRRFTQGVALKRVASIGAVVFVTGALTFTWANHVRSGYHDVESLTKKATFQSGEGASSFSERRDFFRQAMILTKQRPFIGLGPYSFRFVQPHLQTEVLATSDHPHDVFLKFAMERGIPAAVFFALLLLVVLWRGLRVSPLFGEKNGDVFTAVALTSVAGVVAHNLIDYNLQFVGIALPFWLLLGCLAAGSPVEHRMERKPDLWLKLGIAIVILALAATEAGFLVLSSFARHAEVTGDEETALAYYRKTDAALFPRDAWLSRAVMLSNLGKFPDAENAAVTYIGMNAEDARGWRLLGDIYLKWNKRVDAIRAYEKAYDYGKENDAGITRGLVYLLKSDREKLSQRRHEIDSLLNEYGYAIEHNTHFIALGTNVEESVSLARLLAQIYPAEADEYEALAARMEEHAEEERARLASRPRGMLW